MVDDTRTWIDVGRIGVLLFAAVFFLVAVCEGLNPARATTSSFSLRWFGNGVLFLLAWVTGRFLSFLPADAAALVAREEGWGLLNFSHWPGGAAVLLSFITLDFIGYWEHRLYHAVPILWRLHSLHHSDPDLDVTTAIRHHPLEVLTLMPLSAAAALVFGISPESIGLYGTIVTIAQLVQHGNVELPAGLRWLSALVVTPELHRVHHSVDYDESNSNFSNFFPIWDRLFGTLRAEARAVLRIGLPAFSSKKFQRLDRMLALPWSVTPIPR